MDDPAALATPAPAVHITGMATNPHHSSPKPRRTAPIAVRSAATGGFVRKPVSKGARVTLAQVRAAVKKLREQH